MVPHSQSNLILEQWMAGLTSTDPGIQQDLVAKTAIASRSQGISD